jgi:hypothetical protein
MALSAIGLCLGLLLGTEVLPAVTIIEPLTHLLALLDGFPREAMWWSVVAAGAGAVSLALAGLRRTEPLSPDKPSCPSSPGPLQALGAVIRAAESSPTARRNLAARLLPVAAALRAHAAEVPMANCGGMPDGRWPEDSALQAVLQACPGVPPGCYRARLAQALTELEADAKGIRG